MPLADDSPTASGSSIAPLLLMTGWIVFAGPALVRAEPPTYAKEIAPILRARCHECHRAGQVAPFSLDTYDQARKRAGDLADVVQDRRMPPWKPSSDFGPKLKHDRSLSQAEIRLFRAWADAGAPRGVEDPVVPAPPIVDGWKLGPPDLIIEPSVDFEVPAAGTDLYRCFVIPTNLPSDVYVSAVEYRPGNRRVVHHLMAFNRDRRGRSKTRRGRGGTGLYVLLGSGRRHRRRPRRLGTRE